MRTRGHAVEIFDPAKVDEYDVLVFSKAYSAAQQALAQSVKKRGGQVVFDLCDNHFHNPFGLEKYRRAGAEIREMLQIADRVICSTSALAHVIENETQGDSAPIVIGDVVERHPVKEAWTHSDRLRLLWYGSHGSPNAVSGMTDLLLIREELEVLAGRTELELIVCSNSREKFDRSIAGMNVATRYVEWSLEDFPCVLAEADAAILPMTVNPFTACKTHNRLTTALYAGLPVVATGIESYREFESFCVLDDFEGGLASLVEEREATRARALSSREHIDLRWTTGAIAAQWEAALALPKQNPSEGRLKGVQLQGHLDALARDAVTGWVRAPLDPALPLHVALELDGQPIAVGMADLPREDLLRAGIDGRCGFSLHLPPGMGVGSTAHLAVRVLDTDWIVGENPILISSDQQPIFVPQTITPIRVSAAAKRPADPARGDDPDHRQLANEIKAKRSAQAAAQGQAMQRAFAAPPRGFETPWPSADDSVS